MQQRTDQFSDFQMCLESGDGSRTFSNWRWRVPDSWCRDAECLGLEIDPCCRLKRVVADWRISEYERVNGNEPSEAIDSAIQIKS